MGAVNRIAHPGSSSAVAARTMISLILLSALCLWLLPTCAGTAHRAPAQDRSSPSSSTTDSSSATDSAPHGAPETCAALVREYDRRRSVATMAGQAQSGAGTVVSATASGATAVGETVVYVGGGIAFGTLVCSPIIAMEIAAESDGLASTECVSRIGLTTAFGLAEEHGYVYTREVWNSTRDWRLQSYDDLAVFRIDGAECYARQARAREARQVLRELREDDLVWPHLSSFSQQRVDQLERDLAGLAPSTGNQ